MPRTEKKIEREQIEWVFGLTGGELSDKPWPYVYENTACNSPAAYEGTRVRDDFALTRASFRYWYEGAPEYTGADHTGRGSTSNAEGFDVRSAVICALYGMPPEILWDASSGDRWRRVAFYQSSGETECPGRDSEDAPLPCPLCDCADKHGYIYLGDGWGEAVYVRETPRVHFEIIDHGCDGEQYFPGCGVAFTAFTDVATGIGTSAREAAEDAADQLYDTRHGNVCEMAPGLEDAIREMSAAPSFNPDDPDISDEWHHYVSIRWRVERH